MAPYLIKNDNHITDELQIAELMASHYETISSNNSYNMKFQRYRRTHEQPINFSTKESIPYNSPITILELERMLATCTNTAVGEDKITYSMIRRSHESCHHFLIAIYNKIFDTGIYSPQWQSSTVLSFPKPGKNSTLEENFRPISLTSCVGKLMEKIINNRLTFFLESNNHLPPEQFGFRKMHSTIDALNRFTTDISKSLNQKNSVICVSFDMRKAYDTTWRYGILQNMYDIGLRGKLPEYIRCFLSNRLFKTKIGNTYSTYHTLDQGVPQGGVLSCTLFSLAINNILKIIPNTVRASLYVDDLLIY